jgi:hypothetical protein
LGKADSVSGVYLISVQHLELPHLLDPMHIEKNIIVSMIRTFSSAKGSKSDSLAVRQEMEARNMMPGLHPHATNVVDNNGNPVYTYRRPALWVWPKEDFELVLDVLKHVRAPTNYGSSLAYKIGDRKMSGLKTHDWHNILYDLLPVAIRGTLTEGIRETVYRLSRFFKKLCAKQIRVDDIPRLEEEAAELACFMEMNLPPSFFDIQPHHIVHLPGELRMAGPVRPRWMYFVERYLRVLKGWVRQMARPESCIAEVYITHEAMKFAQDYCDNVDPSWTSTWKDEDDTDMSKEALPRAYTQRLMTDVLYEQAHRFVLMNHPAMEKWMERYNALGQGTSSVPSFRHWVKEAVQDALGRGDSISQEVLDISAGPKATAKFFAGKFYIFQVYLCMVSGKCRSRVLAWVQNDVYKNFILERFWFTKLISS